nr:kelch repeat-containing protein [Rhizobium sp. SG570]
MGGEQRDFDRNWQPHDKVFGQLESYDPTSDTWQSHAPMMTPRHGLGAVALGDWIRVAGGEPAVGGGMQSSIHEAFTLG